jgi:hypothetical protein
MSVELFLNSVWALLALAIVCFWLRQESPGHTRRRSPFIALVMLIVVLFPVISVSDDLWSMQNPAETDSCQRRAHLASCPHSLFPAMSSVPESPFIGVASDYQELIAPPNRALRTVDNPAFDAIQNRPPPAA